MKKLISIILFITLLLSALPLCVSAARKTPVEKYGQLQVIGSQLCDSNGEAVQLRGMSSHGLAWYGEYCNKDVIEWLRDDWNCDIYRASMYTAEWGGYIDNPDIKSKVYEAVDACIELGMYVIIDWHILEDNNPQTYKTQAKAFFNEMSEKYGDCPNVLYEIMNEPNGDEVTWLGDCKPYAQEVIPVIRANDPDNIIIVGGPSWSSLQQEVINSPLTEFNNIAYTVHQYTNEPQSYWPLSRMTAAMNKGMCVFVSEWGCTDPDGDGVVGEESARIFLDYLDANKISWVNWNISDKDEASACLVHRTGQNRVSTSGGWSEDDLSVSGKFIRNELRKTLSDEPDDPVHMFNVLRIGNANVYNNFYGVYTVDRAPIIRNHKAFVPLRNATQLIYADIQDYNENDEFFVVFNNYKVKMQINNTAISFYTIDGTFVESSSLPADQVPIIEGGKAYLPARALADIASMDGERHIDYFDESSSGGLGEFIVYTMGETATTAELLSVLQTANRQI